MSKLYTRGGFAEPGTSLEFKTGSWRVQKPQHNHRPAPCHAVCPAGEDAQAWLSHVDTENYQAAWQEIARINPLPGITGRVCPHPCESACNRGDYDSPVAIHGIERYLGDQALEKGWDYAMPKLSGDAAQVAVIGAGPAGLSAAWHLRRLGLRPVVFEKHLEAGGMLLTAIPAYRLPKTHLAAEIEHLLACGDIDLRTRHILGRDVSLEELHQDYAAVCLAPGQAKPSDWTVDGVTPGDLHPGLDLLEEWNNLLSAPNPEKAAVIGAGNTAVDVARVLIRAGAKEVHLISHKAKPGPDVPPEDTMPAYAEELTEAEREGVIIHEHRGVRRLILRGERVVGIEMVSMKKLRDDNGRLRRVPFEGTEQILHVDQVIPAVGQTLDTRGYESLLNQRGWLDVDPQLRVPGQNSVWVAGDATWQAGTVSAAIGQGRRAAESIARQLAGTTMEQPTAAKPVSFQELNLHYHELRPRQPESSLPVNQRDPGTEVNQGLETHQVQQEAKRCLSCGNCMACDNCWTLCPDSAVLKTQNIAADGSHYVFDYDYCKGCGLCANECPCGYIEMTEEF